MPPPSPQTHPPNPSVGYALHASLFFPKPESRIPPGPKSRFTSEQEAEVARLVQNGPSLSEHGVVRWRRIDLSHLNWLSRRGNQPPSGTCIQTQTRYPQSHRGQNFFMQIAASSYQDCRATA
jgi:hypothetical protein